MRKTLAVFAAILFIPGLTAAVVTGSWVLLLPILTLSGLLFRLCFRQEGAFGLKKRLQKARLRQLSLYMEGRSDGYIRKKLLDTCLRSFK